MPAIDLGFVGDSITAGAFGNPVAAAAAYLAGHGYSIVNTTNQGIGGSTSAGWVSGSANLNAALSAFAGGVRVVHVMLGTNDAQAAVNTSPSQYLANLTSLTGALVSAGYKVILSKPIWTVPNADSGVWIADPGTLYGEFFTNALTLVNGTSIFAGDSSAFTYSEANAGTFLAPDGVHPADAAANNTLGGFWGAAIANNFPASGSGMAQRTTILTAGTTWAVPANYGTPSTVHCIGGGSGAASGDGSNAPSAGAGGGWSKSVNVAFTPGSTVAMAIGPGGAGAPLSSTLTNGGAGGDTWIATNNTATLISSTGVACGAKGGAVSVHNIPNTAGGAAASGVATGTGSAKFSGGPGAQGTGSNGRGGAGGAGGPNGNGATGGFDPNAGSFSSGGGGGNGGGSAGASPSSGTNSGGNGGNNSGGTGGGAGGAQGVSGNPGTNGGGGGGSGGVTGGTTGGAGGNGIDIQGTVGGGGGGGQGQAIGGGGGLYGGGGGAATSSITGEAGGSGAQGLIVIIDTPNAASMFFAA